MPKVSICIPTYNGEHFIRRCLQSVFRQTYTDYEVIISDDLSTDRTLEVIYKTFPQVTRIYQNPRRFGAPANWNKAISAADGKYIKPLFQDDILAPTYLEEMIEHEIFSEIFFQSCRRTYDVCPGLPTEYLTGMQKMAEIVPPQTPEALTTLFSEYTFANLLGEPSAWIFNERLLPAFGSFNENLAQLADIDLAMRFASNLGCRFVDKPLINITLHKGSLSQNNDPFRSQIMDHIVIMHEILFNGDYTLLKDAIRKRQPDYYEKFIKRVKLAQIAARESCQANVETFDRIVNYYPLMLEALEDRGVF